MYLKRLEIQGFKSFADKTVLEFKPGITLVVGPNGSGKSNIADSIRWVLGEQSVKTLRGGKMEDVIFAGSEKRRSLGMAEVSLTIDNAKGVFPLEFNEVTVTRRLYRSGESDFLINRVPCRLRDIHELFMDTGVGREGISIIGQGKIDEILSVKPEERRGLIEEAAGIVKYRYRKREAERKLEETENSLIRLDDIVTELTTQEEPLAEQARVAGIYQGLKNELDALEVGLLLDEMSGTSKKLEAIKNSKQAEEEALEEKRVKQHLLQAREEETKLVLQKNEERLSTCQERVYTESLRLEKNESEKKLIHERLSDIDRQDAFLQRDILSLKSEQENLEKEFAEQKDIGEGLNHQLLAARENLASYEREIEVETKREQEFYQELEKLKGEHFEALQEEARIKNDKTAYTQRLSILNRQAEQNEARKKASLQELEEVNLKLEELEKEEAQLQQVKLSLETALKEQDTRYLQEERKTQELQKKNRALIEEKNNSMARLKVLNEMERDGQGYGLGVKEILRSKGEGPFAGVVGTVAQVIGVPKPYELAVEVVLGSALQHLITEDEHVARQAIAWLKEHDKGRVTFLPLTTIKGSRIPDKIPSGTGVVGQLSQLLNYDQRFARVIEFLMGRVFLMENLESAVLKAKETQFSYRLVTLDGQLVNPGGSMTGGSTRPSNTGILSRRRNITDLTQDIQRLENLILKGEKEETQQGHLLEEINKAREAVKAKLQDTQIKKAENEKIQERWRAERVRFKTEHETVVWQINEVLKEKESVQDYLESSEQDVAALTQRVLELAAQIQTNQEEAKLKQAERIKKNEHLTQMRIDVATIQEKITSYQKDVYYFNHRISQLQQQQGEKSQEMIELQDKKAHLQTTLTEMAHEKEGQMASLQALERELEDLKAVRFEIQDRINQIAQEVKDFVEYLRTKEEKIHQFEMTLAKYESGLEACSRRLEEQYQLDMETAGAKGAEIKDRRLAQQRIYEAKQEIIDLGAVNLAAIEDYARLCQRLEFLTNQTRDMREAKERLQQVIQEMDVIMTRKFKETFDLVDQAFQEMFTRLFGGGRAQLYLTDAENLLESGVDIMAQPPGKKTQTLTLLSGGEKALTAIALLMAVLKIKPSPFCVLDEIESNLDEANVHRFAALLQEFAQETQFIVISHHKGTMEVAHVMYGITIEENGISRLISVRFEDIKEEAS